MYDNKAEKIKDRINMQDVLLKYGFEPKRRMKCPLHNGNDYNFEVKEKTFTCYSRCGNGDVITFVQKLFSLPFSDALTRIDEDFGLGLYKRQGERERLSTAKRNYEESRKRRERKRETERVNNKYHAALDEYARLDRQMIDFRPKSPDEPPRREFIEALQNIETAGYMLGLAEEEVYLNEQRNAN
jgi:DNA primase